MGLFDRRRDRRDPPQADEPVQPESPSREEQHAAWIEEWDREAVERREREARAAIEESRAAEAARVDRLMKWGEDILAVRSVEVLERLNSEVDRAVELYMEAEEAFEERSAHPFWGVMMALAAQTDQAVATFDELAALKQEYAETSAAIPGLLSPYVDLEGISAASDIIMNLRIWLVSLHDKAQTIDVFITAYGFLMLKDALQTGFASLKTSFDRLELSIRRSTAILSADISRLGDDLSGLTSTLGRQYSNASLDASQQTREIVRAVNKGLDAATGAITTNARTAQARADTSISELRQIQSRVEQLKWRMR